MSRVFKNINEFQSVKNGEIPVPPENEIKKVDLHRGVVGKKVDRSGTNMTRHEFAQTLFPIDCLPTSIRDIVTNCSTAERTPASIAACCALGIVSVALGKNLRIHSHPGKICPGNLYIICAAPSGSNKSETFRPIATPVYSFQMECFESWKREEFPGLQAEKKYHEARIKAFENLFKKVKPNPDEAIARNELQGHLAKLQEIEDKLHGPNLLCENATSEAVGQLLSDNHECIASLSSDARELIDVLAGRYRSGGKTDEGIYLKGYSLEPYPLHRLNRPPLSLREICISCLWLVQPDKLEEMLTTRSLSAGGLLPRFLICSVNFLPKPIDRNGTGIDSSILTRWDVLIRTVLKTYRLGETTHTLTPSHGAIKLLDDHFNSILNHRGTDLSSINEYAARWNEQAWRLSVVLHAGEYGSSAHEHELSEKTAQSAITIADWFAKEQLRVLGWSRDAAKTNLQERVLALAAREPDGIIAAGVYHQRIVADAKGARDLLSQMEAEGLLRCERVARPGGGWASERYFLPAHE